MNGRIFTTTTVRRLLEEQRHDSIGVEKVKLHPWWVRNRNARPETDIFAILGNAPRDVAGAGVPAPLPG